MRLAGDYRDIKLPNPYLHRSVSLQVKTNSRGIIPTYEQYGSIWHSSGNFRNQGVLVGERGKDRQINPLSAKALKFYEVLQDIAIESVCEEDD